MKSYLLLMLLHLILIYLSEEIRSKNYINLKNDTIGKPLFDRGLQGQYPPGSTFKLVNALIALQENVINEKTIISCNLGHYYSKKRFMKCHCEIGTRNNLDKAIYNSCNTYFANIYKQTIEKFPNAGIGIDQLERSTLVVLALAIT